MFHEEGYLIFISDIMMDYNESMFWLKEGISYRKKQMNLSLRRKMQYKYQEFRLKRLLKSIDVRTIYEAGCGYGRITNILRNVFPRSIIYACDISKEQLNQTKKHPKTKYFVDSVYNSRGKRKGDLSIAVELFMHIKPENIEKALKPFIDFSSKHIINIDWFDPAFKGKSNFCFQHDYKGFYETLVEYPYFYKEIDLTVPIIGVKQKIFHVEIEN